MLGTHSIHPSSTSSRSRKSRRTLATSGSGDGDGDGGDASGDASHDRAGSSRGMAPRHSSPSPQPVPLSRPPPPPSSLRRDPTSELHPRYPLLLLPPSNTAAATPSPTRTITTTPPATTAPPPHLSPSSASTASSCNSYWTPGNTDGNTSIFDGYLDNSCNPTNATSTTTTTPLTQLTNIDTDYLLPPSSLLRNSTKHYDTHSQRQSYLPPDTSYYSHTASPPQPAQTLSHQASDSLAEVDSANSNWACRPQTKAAVDPLRQASRQPLTRDNHVRTRTQNHLNHNQNQNQNQDQDQNHSSSNTSTRSPTESPTVIDEITESLLIHHRTRSRSLANKAKQHRYNPYRSPIHCIRTTDLLSPQPQPQLLQFSPLHLQHHQLRLERQHREQQQLFESRQQLQIPNFIYNTYKMAPGPIDIHPAPGGSPGALGRTNSGGQITSNLTSGISALRAAGEIGQTQNGIPANQPSITNGFSGMGMDRGMTTAGINIGGGASAANHGSGKMLRRESMAASEGMRSLMNGGMSWGGVSVGSWIRDDIIMTGTSPFTYNSPSFHSSSYLPKLEANFFRDFACCGQTLPSLHDLLQHYEEVHAQQLQNGSMQLPAGVTRDGNGSLSAPGAPRPQQSQQSQQSRMTPLSSQNTSSNRNDRMGSIGHAAGSGLDVESMEMDDDDGQITPPSNGNPVSILPGLGQLQQPMQPQAQSALRLAQQMPHQQQPQLHNPTVSSVNTPNMPNPTQGPSGNPFANEHSVPGTPRGLDSLDFDINTFQSMNIGNASYLPLDGDMGLELCIDDPGKALFNHLGSGAPRAGGYPQNMTLAQLRAARDQADLARMMGDGMLHQGAMGAGVNIPGGPMGNDWGSGTGEDKPFKCPVIGCEKAYKNQNGLKYHKNHGHINQTLHLNPDGSYSIVNPETSIPYPGTLGMEKEKPYKCEYCGKRYKNLNGLKYHRGHSTHGHPPITGTGGIAISDNAIGDIGEE